MEDSKKNSSLISVRRPCHQPYSSLLLSGSFLKSSLCNDDNYSMAGFTEFRKYKKANESRKIRPYEPIKMETDSNSNQELNFPEIEIKDSRKFILDLTGHIPVENIQSLLKLVQQHPDIGFITMKREHMDLVRDYKPYHYTICHFNDIDKSDYVTISPNGLVEFYKDYADFLPLERLEKEYHLYHTLKQIPFFQTFRLWKSFMVWFNKIRQRKFMIAKENIETFFAEKFTKTSPKFK